MTTITNPPPLDQQDRRNAALRGALSAFSTPSSPVNSTHASQQRDLGAFAAATKVGAHVPQPPPKKPELRSTTSSTAAVLAHNRRSQQLNSPPSRLQRSQNIVSIGHPPSDAQHPLDSPSNAAASLAFARHSPRRPDAAPYIHYMPQPSRKSSAAISVDDNSQDILPAAGTVGGVRKWLQTLGDGSSESHLPPSRRSSQPQLHTRSASAESSSKSRRRRPSHHVRDSEVRQGRQSSTDIVAGEKAPPPEIHSPKPLRPITVSGKLNGPVLSPSQPHPRRETSLSPKHVHSSKRPRSQRIIDDVENTSPNDSTRLAKLRNRSISPGTSLNLNPRPVVPPPRRSRRKDSSPEQPLSLPIRLNASLTKPEDTDKELPMSSARPSVERQARDALALRSTTPKPADSPASPFPVRKITPHLTGDSLANAMVAGSLASSRAPSPTRSPATPITRHQHEKHRLPFRHFKTKPEDSRTPSPAKGMRFTMRHQPSASDDEELRNPKRHRKMLIRKHPHKHHEGDRKRWRDEITANERKRYEGVWAANRGIFMDPAGSEPGEEMHNSVCNLVVRDLWRRSRLPDHVLEEVWDLVDDKGVGALGRAEFVVGMWLIDQRLKGRKLPIRVSDSIWRSARGVQGIQMPRYREK